MFPQGNTIEGRFVVLRHECGPANGGAAASHWDLMLELPGHEKLLTWQIKIAPQAWSAEVAAKRLEDHRPIYMTYEGPVSGNRGHVKRIDAGAAVVVAWSPWKLRLSGQILRQEIYLRETSDSF